MKREKSKIEIQITGLKDGIYDFNFFAQPQGLDLPGNFSEFISVQVEIEKIKGSYIFSVQLQTNTIYECDRCLNEIKIPLTNTFSILCSTDRHELMQLDQDDEVRFLGLNEHTIDITDDVRQYILLAVPLRKVCGEDENGQSLCTQSFNFSLKSDERKSDALWSELKKIKFDS